MKLTEVIDSLIEERGLNKEQVSSIVCDGILAAYEKKYPDVTFSISLNKKTGDMEVAVEKTVVAVVEHPFNVLVIITEYTPPAFTLAVAVPAPEIIPGPDHVYVMGVVVELAVTCMVAFVHVIVPELLASAEGIFVSEVIARVEVERQPAAFITITV